MSATPPTGSPPRTRFWSRTLAIEIAVLLAIPLVLGATLGFFEINPVESEDLTPVGYDAHLLLNSFPDDSLVVEFAYESNVGPPPNSAVAVLLDRINETCQKASVTVDEHEFTSDQSTFSDAQLWNLELAQRQHWPFWGTMSLFYLYLGGSYGPDSSVIGLAYRGSSIAIFEGTIDSDSSLLSNTAAYTTTVLVHEFGHELGLVGIIGNAPNEDHAHPPHSTDPNDVMYWEVDTTAISVLGPSPPTQFDSADLSDLATVRATPIWTELLPWAVLAVCVAAAALLLWSVRQERRRAPTARPK
ncbi:MAG: hypothetical protein WBG19_06635 [Thermoplasmata archaeon]